MGYTLGKSVPPLERELNYLLYDLCVHWGFCITSDERIRISKMAQYNALDFARDVVSAEGMSSSDEWMKRIAVRFTERFGTDEIETSTFVDRIRGVKETW